MRIKRFTQFTLVLAIIALIVGLSACDEIGQLLVPPQPEMPPEMEAHEIPIGVVLAQTGDNTAYGLPMQDGFKLALEEINNSGMLHGAKLKLIIEDDQSVSAVAAVDKLINEDSVPVITGFALSSQLKPVIQTADDNKVVLFSSVSSFPGLSELSDFVFRAGLTSAVLNPPLVKATHEKYGYQKAATIYDEDDLYSVGSHKVFEEALTANGVDIVITETLKTHETDFEAQLTQIMEAAPDALFISALSAEMIEIMIQAHELMPSVRLIAPEMTNIEVEGAGDAAEGLTTAIGWRSTDDSPMNQAFVQKYTETYGEEPVAWAAQSYATLHILAAAIAQSADATALRGMLAGTMDFPTILGNFSFNEVGDAVYDPILLTVKNGEFVAFE